MYNFKLVINLPGAAVALVVLIDLAASQGPPAYGQNYGPPMALRPDFYVSREEYESKKEYDAKKDKEEHESKDHEKLDKDVKKFEKEYKYDKKDDDDDKYGDESTTVAPGVVSSFSNSMSSAWSKYWQQVSRTVDAPKIVTNAECPFEYHLNYMQTTSKIVHTEQFGNDSTRPLVEPWSKCSQLAGRRF